jgi:hypothetical protein
VFDLSSRAKFATSRLPTQTSNTPFKPAIHHDLPAFGSHLLTEDDDRAAQLAQDETDDIIAPIFDQTLDSGNDSSPEPSDNGFDPPESARRGSLPVDDVGRLGALTMTRKTSSTTISTGGIDVSDVAHAKQRRLRTFDVRLIFRKGRNLASRIEPDSADCVLVERQVQGASIVARILEFKQTNRKRTSEAIQAG